jgi:hypothetical protein
MLTQDLLKTGKRSLHLMSGDSYPLSLTLPENQDCLIAQRKPFLHSLQCRAMRRVRSGCGAMQFKTHKAEFVELYRRVFRHGCSELFASREKCRAGNLAKAQDHAPPFEHAVHSRVIGMTLQLSLLVMRRNAEKDGKPLPIQQALV